MVPKTGGVLRGACEVIELHNPMHSSMDMVM